MRGKRWKTILAILVAILLSGIALWALWPGRAWDLLASREALEEWIETFGAWGPLAIVVGEVLQVLAAPVPGQVVGVVAGYLYGVFWGTLLCMAGLALGTALAIWLARLLGRPLVERLASEELLTRIDNYAQRRGALTFFLIFLLPFLPDDICCFVAGLSPLRISELMVLAIVGRAPGLIVSTLIGSQARNLSWSQLTLIGIVSLALAALFAVCQEKLERLMFSLIDRFNPSD